MALKAGRYGVTKAQLEALKGGGGGGGSVKIKSIGDGLNLSEEGELSVIGVTINNIFTSNTSVTTYNLTDSIFNYDMIALCSQDGVNKLSDLIFIPEGFYTVDDKLGRSFMGNNYDWLYIRENGKQLVQETHGGGLTIRKIYGIKFN